MVLDRKLRDKCGDGDDMIIIYMIRQCVCIRPVTCFCSYTYLFIVPLSRIFASACMKISQNSVHRPPHLSRKENASPIIQKFNLLGLNTPCGENLGMGSHFNWLNQLMHIRMKYLVNSCFIVWQFGSKSIRFGKHIKTYINTRILKRLNICFSSVSLGFKLFLKKWKNSTCESSII